MERIYHIRNLYFVKGKSIRQIAVETGIDRATIRKYIEQENFSDAGPVYQRRKSKTEPYRDQVRRILLEDDKSPRKQRHTAKRIYDRLKEQAVSTSQEFPVSERSIRYLVADLRTELRQSELAALPLLHPPGEAQVDFGATVFEIKGVRFEGYHLGITFPHSDAKYVQLFKGQNFECLARGLSDIFQHIGGVPTVIRFDNMSIAVKKIKAQGEREVTENFRRLQCHYDFESNFCNPASGHEKGSVENYIGYSRRNYFVPIPQMEDLEVFNRELLKRCDGDLRRKHYKQEKQVLDLFAADKAAFRPLSSYEFDACCYVPGRTNNYGMVRFDGNSYSTAGHLRTANVLLKLTAHTAQVLDMQMNAIVTHPRLYGKGKESMVWGPYLKVLAQRPTALQYSGFFETLQGPLRGFLGNCTLEGKKHILETLAHSSDQPLLEQSLAHMTEAVAMATKEDVDSVLAAYAFIQNGPGQLPKNPVAAHLPKTPEYEVDLSVYMAMLGGAGCTRT